MEQIRRIFAGLSWRQRIVILTAVVAVIAGIMSLTRWNRERDFRPLYTGLAPEDAGAVVARLRELGVDYRLSENGTTVLAPSARVAETRLQLASSGLPKSGRIGFELFDKTSFGATEFTEKVNYHRALEGELERSIMSVAEVEQARVHLTFAKESVFSEQRQPAKASVLVRLRAGARLSPPSVMAIRHLVASAVQGLDPEVVSVVDMRGNLLGRPKRPLSAEGAEAPDAMIEFRQQVERDLLAKINATLEPLLGAERFRAGVFAECDFSSGEQSEESFDPARSIMSSSQRTEDLTTGSGTSGVPGTASNLPRPASRPGSASGGVSRRTENIVYQASRTVRRTRLPMGGLRRLSAAVLVDHAVRWQGQGAQARRVVAPVPPEELKAIHGLVAAAIGLTPGRGDQLTVECLPFESTLTGPPQEAAPQAPGAGPGGGWLDSWLGGRPLPAPLAAGGAALLLALAAGGWFLFRRWRRKSKVKALLMQAELQSAGSREAIAAREEAASRQVESALAEQVAQKERAAAEAIHALKLPQATTKKAEVLGKHLVEEAKKDPLSMAQLIRAWLNESDA